MVLPPLQFVPLHTFVDPALWAELSRRRIDEWQLETPTVAARGSYSIYGRLANDCTLTLGHDALVAADAGGGRDVDVRGRLRLLGTLKDFQQTDPKAIMSRHAEELWQLIKSPETLAHPSALSAFELNGFADVKQYAYYFAIYTPALLYPSNLCAQSSGLSEQEEREHSALLERFRKEPTSPFLRLSNSQLAPLSDLTTLDGSGDVSLVFGDPSAVANAPGWPLRNLLALIAFHKPQWSDLRVIALRGDAAQTRTFHIHWERPSDEATPRAVGIQKPTSVNLKSAFDPIKLMENSVDMNLKLVRWRMVPSLNLTAMADLRVLMLGAGTLGCNLARALLGWGIRRFTFVDNATISYNNPVRQSLYEFEDCKAGNRQKATAAAAALKRIFPSVDTRGVSMKIPMPGHTVSDAEEDDVIARCDQLEKLISDHDVTFLVMDSREARWLPAVFATQQRKLCITVALGFDTLVVMRHGVPLSPQERDETATTRSPPPSGAAETAIAGADLGCYYCNDVTAPGNSTADRTLDQNCTISRAGVSYVAAGLATELLASLWQHADGAAAPALIAAVDESSSILGATPHQIRGFLSRFQFMMPTVQRFRHCIACGSAVQRALGDRRREFLLSVFNDSEELGRLSGLADIQSSVNDLDLGVLEVGDESDEA